MKSRSPWSIGGIVALVVLVAAAVFALFRPGTTTITIDDRPPITAPEDGSAVVAFLRESGGLSLLGIRFADSTHHVEVQFLAPAGCSALLRSGDPWPSPHQECSVPVEVTGEVGGLGVMETGESMVGVQFTVSRGCYESLEPGMAWPPDDPGCPR